MKQQKFLKTELNYLKLLYKILTPFKKKYVVKLKFTFPNILAEFELCLNTGSMRSRAI
jgi:hypothetical protein